MTYNVFGRTLNLTQLQPIALKHTIGLQTHKRSVSRHVHSMSMLYSMFTLSFCALTRFIPALADTCIHLAHGSDNDNM